jgi:hypothetical protein
MTRPSRVSVSGPLVEFTEGFRAELACLGYSPWTSEAQLRLMKQLSGWLASQGLYPHDDHDRGARLRTHVPHPSR